MQFNIHIYTEINKRIRGNINITGIKISRENTW